jgi:hypothetical protein
VWLPEEALRWGVDGKIDKAGYAQRWWRAMDRVGIARVAAVAIAACAVAATVPGQAQTPDDHAAAGLLVQKLEADTAHGSIISVALAHAKEAIERATRLRGAGDEAHAKAADGLAREWAETARDLARAADAEESAAALRRRGVEAQAHLEHTRALVEEGIARIGRLRAELEEARRAPVKERTALETHEGDQGVNKPEPKGRPAVHPAPRPEKP